jgi:hypothetical protein
MGVMKKTIYFLSFILVSSILSGCILSKTPSTNSVTMYVDEQKTFSVKIFPSNATYSWTMDSVPLSNNEYSYLYSAFEGNHSLVVKAKHFLGTDTQTWNIQVMIGFNKTFGGVYNDIAKAIQQTSDGGYILAGDTKSFGSGLEDVWLIKTDSNGNKVWDKTFGGSNSDLAFAVQQTSDGGYILAGITYSYGAGCGDAWLIKTDSDGNKIWDKIFGGVYDDYAFAVQQTDDGGYILAGGTNSYLIGYENAWLIKTDSEGNKVWDKIFGGSNFTLAFAVQQTSDGGFVLAGVNNTPQVSSYGNAWLTKTDSNGNMVWEKTFGGSKDGRAQSVQQTNDGGYILAGYTNSYGAGYYDVWLIKTDKNGNKVWDKTFGGIDGEYANAVQQTSDGGYILAGYTDSYGSGGYDAWLIKTYANGNMVWNKTFGGSMLDIAYAVQQTSDGGYILAGLGNCSYESGNGDAWLIKTDANGNAPSTQTP